MNQFRASTRLTLVGIFLLAVVLITALVDMNFHFSPLIVIAIMLVATVIGAQVLTNHSE